MSSRSDKELADMYYESLNHEEKVVSILEKVRDLGLPTEKQNFIMFPCSGNLSMLAIPFLLLRPDTNNAIKKLVLIGREKDALEGKISGLEKFATSSAEVWRNSAEIFVPGGVKDKIDALSYSNREDLESQIKKVNSRLHPEDTTMIYLPRYSFLGLLDYFDEEKLIKNLTTIIDLEKPSLKELTPFLHKDAIRNIKKNMISLPEIYQSIERSRIDFRTSFRRGEEEKILEDMFAVKEKYTEIVASEFNKVDKEKIGAKAAFLASNIIGAREFGRMLRETNYQGRIINLTNPLDTISYVLCAASGLPPERVLGFRHNDLERVRSFYKSKGLEIEEFELLGLHHRMWSMKEDELPYAVKDPASRVEISRYVRGMFSSMQWTLDTAVHLVILLESMARKKDEKAGFSWYHSTKEGSGVYLAGICDLSKKQFFPKFNRANHSVENVCELLENEGEYDVVKGIECEIKSITGLGDAPEGKTPILSSKEILREVEIDNRREAIARASQEHRDNPFYVVGFSRKDCFLYNDEGRVVSNELSLGSFLQIHSNGEHIYAVTSKPRIAGKAGLSFHKLHTSKLSIEEKTRLEIKEGGRADVYAKKGGNLTDFLLSSSKEVLNFGPRTPFENNEGVIDLSIPGASKVALVEQEDIYVYFISESGISRSRYDTGELEAREVVIEGTFEDLKVEKDCLITKTPEAAVLYSFSDFGNPLTIIHGVHDLEDVRTDGKLLYNLHEGNLFSSDGQSISLGKVMDYDVIDRKVGWVDEDKIFRVHKIGTEAPIIEVNIENNPIKIKLMVK